jgi:hypothetical protein
LRALDVSIVPPGLRVYGWLPEPLGIIFLRRLLRDEKMKIALEGHANAARDEVAYLVDELLALARTAHVPTPNIDRLYSYFDAATPLIPDGSQEIPMKWW